MGYVCDSVVVAVGWHAMAMYRRTREEALSVTSLVHCHVPPALAPRAAIGRDDRHRITMIARRMATIAARSAARAPPLGALASRSLAPALQRRGLCIRKFRRDANRLLLFFSVS